MSDRDAFAELKADQGHGICPIHGYGWRYGRNMANAPLGLHCPYDGSMHPDEFMAYLEKPGTKLGPTDKSYKVYVSVASDETDEMRVVSSTTTQGDAPPRGRDWLTYEDAVERHPELREEYEHHVKWIADTCAPSHPWHTATHWVQVGPRGSRLESKFYFEHLSDEQRARFVALLNDGKLNVGEPGFFYSKPFFLSERTP